MEAVEGGFLVSWFCGVVVLWFCGVEDFWSPMSGSWILNGARAGKRWDQVICKAAEPKTKKLNNHETEKLGINKLVHTHDT